MHLRTCESVESQKSLGPQIREVPHLRKVRQYNKLFKSASFRIFILRTYLRTDLICLLHSQHYLRTERLLPVPKPNPKHCCFTHYLERPEQYQRTQNLNPDHELKIVEPGFNFRKLKFGSWDQHRYPGYIRNSGSGLPFSIGKIRVANPLSH
jgi:hypothetical protein